MRREFHVRFCEGPGGQFPRATRLVIAFERHDDAQRVMQVLPQRMAKYGLRLHPDKTRLLPIGRPSASDPGGKGPATFDFLGFTVFWRRTHGGNGWRVGMTTRKGRLRGAIEALGDWCRRHRHEPLKEQQAGLARRLDGHFNYFGVQGNFSALARLSHAARRLWFKWLNRRSQRARLTWERFRSIRVRLWGDSS